MGSGMREARCQLKKTLLPLCVLIVLLILCVYAPTSTRIIAISSPKALPRPMVMGQLVQSSSHQVYLRSWNTTRSSNISTSATQPSRVLSFNQTIEELQQSQTEFDDKKTSQPLFQFASIDGVSVASMIQSLPSEAREKFQSSGFDVQNSSQVKEFLSFLSKYAIKQDVTKEEKQPATESMETNNDSKSVDIIIPEPILDSHEVLPTSSDKCDPINKIIFIKTHKTGSTTTASIFERYGYRRNLVFALPKTKHVFPTTYFSKKGVIPIPPVLAKKHPNYDILTNHAVYNRKEMDKVIPSATYITIIRDPVSQLESAFGYFEMSRGMGLSKEKNPFETFMQNPSYYYDHKNYTMKLRSRNGQMIDLGLPGSQANDSGAIKNKIDTLDREFDLVLITEYFDESLILMKKLLCWSFDDILYISNGIRSKSHRFTLSDDLGEKVRQWNAGDVLLYNHFNRTLWQKVQDYGPNFETDLEFFRKLEKEAVDRCIDSNKTDTEDRREEKFVINPKHSGKYCQELLRADVEYTILLKQKMGVMVKNQANKRTSNKKPPPRSRRKRPSHVKPQRTRQKRGR